MKAARCAGRWPGASAGLCLGRPARRTPGRTPQITQIEATHSSRPS